MCSGSDALADADVAAEFIRAFNDGDVAAFEALVDPEVELHSRRGLRRGRDAARRWATRSPGGVQQSILVERMRAREEPGRSAVVVALISRRWHWEEDGSFAGAEPMAWLFELRDGLVLSWRPFECREDALRAAGLGA